MLYEVITAVRGADRNAELLHHVLTIDDEGEGLAGAQADQGVLNVHLQQLLQLV